VLEIKPLGQASCAVAAKAHEKRQQTKNKTGEKGEQEEDQHSTTTNNETKSQTLRQNRSRTSFTHKVADARVDADGRARQGLVAARGALATKCLRELVGEGAGRARLAGRDRGDRAVLAGRARVAGGLVVGWREACRNWVRRRRDYEDISHTRQTGATDD